MLQVQRRGGITTFEDAEGFERCLEMRRFQQRQDDKHSKKVDLNTHAHTHIHTQLLTHTRTYEMRRL